MRLISNHELQQRSESELSGLFRAVSEGLVRTRGRCPRIKISLGRCRFHRLLRGSRVWVLIWLRSKTSVGHALSS